MQTSHREIEVNLKPTNITTKKETKGEWSIYLAKKKLQGMMKNYQTKSPIEININSHISHRSKKDEENKTYRDGASKKINDIKSGKSFRLDVIDLIPKTKNSKDSARKTRISCRKSSDHQIHERTNESEITVNIDGSVNRKTAESFHPKSDFNTSFNYNRNSTSQGKNKANKSNILTKAFNNKKCSADDITLHQKLNIRGENAGSKYTSSNHNTNYSTNNQSSVKQPLNYRKDGLSVESSKKNSSNSISSQNPTQESHLFTNYLKNKENVNSVLHPDQYGVQSNVNLMENDSLIEMIKHKEIQANLVKKDNMMSNLELVQDFSKTKQKCFSRNKSVNSIDIDISDINFLFDKKLSNAEKMSLLNLRKQRDNKNTGNISNRGHYRNNTEFSNNQIDMSKNDSNSQSNTYRNYITNKSMAKEKANDNSIQVHDQTTNLQNNGIKIPTNMINPNEFYQKTVNKHKKAASPEKISNNAPNPYLQINMKSQKIPNINSANLSALTNNIQNKNYLSNNINSARVESRKVPEEMDRLNKKRFSSKFEKGVYKINEDDVSMIGTNNTSNNEHMRNFLANDRSLLERTNTKSRGDHSGRGDYDSQDKKVSNNPFSRDARKKNVMIDYGSPINGHENVKYSARQNSSVKDNSIISITKDAIDTNRHSNNSPYKIKSTRKISKENSVKSRNLHPDSRNSHREHRENVKQIDLDSILDKRSTREKIESLRNDNHNGYIEHRSNKVFRRKNHSQPNNAYDNNDFTSKNFNLDSNNSNLPKNNYSKFPDNESFMNKNEFNVNDIGLNSQNGPRHHPTQQAYQQGNCTINLNLKKINNLNEQSEIVSARGKVSNNRPVTRTNSINTNQKSDSNLSASNDYRNRLEKSPNDGRTYYHKRQKSNLKLKNPQSSRNYEETINSKTDSKSKRIKGNRNGYSEAELLDRNSKVYTSNNQKTDAASIEVSEKDEVKNKRQNSKKDKILARLTAKRSSMPDNGINNKLANELNIPLNFKQISMTPDASRNVSPVMSISKSKNINADDIDLGHDADVRRNKNDNSKLILNTLKEQSITHTEDEFDFSLKQEQKSLIDFIKNYHAQNKAYPKTTQQFYKILKMIGKGSFGKVHQGLHILTGKKVAMKCIDKAYIKEEKAQKKIIQEVKILRSLDNPQIIKILEVFENKKYVFIVTEFASSGDLLKYMRENGLLKEKMTKKIAVQILRGLDYCHNKKILHRDIKLDNILLDNKMKVKLCDFGVSRFMPEERIFERCGTPAYIAPEVINGDGYTGYAADIWSQGVLLYALMTGTIPFKAKNIPDLHKIILNNDFTFPSGIFLSQQFKSLIRLMLLKEPEKRISQNEMWGHDWLKDYADMYPKNEKKKLEISGTVVEKINQFGYSKNAVLDSLQSNQMNHISATYYQLLA